MKDLLQLLLVLVALVLFGPLVVIITIIRRIELAQVKIDLTNVGRLSRIIIGVLGLVIWLAVYVPLIWLLITITKDGPPINPPGPTLLPPPANGEIVDRMDSAAGWNVHPDGNGSVISMRVVQGMMDNAIEIGYALKPNGWVAIHRMITPSIFVGTNKIRFYYSGYGTPNTIELKLVYANNVIFGVVRSSATETNGEWKMIEALYSEFKCWPDTGCNPSDTLDVRKVEKIDIAISNKPAIGDVACTSSAQKDDLCIGVIRIDNIVTGK